MPLTRRFVILPPLGVRLASSGVRLARRALSLEHFMAAIARPRQVAKSAVEGATVKVLDSVHDDGAKLVEMRAEDVMKLRSAQPGVRVVPEVFFRPARAPRPQVHPVAATAARKTVTVTVRVVSRTDGKPVARAEVIAFTDYDAREGGAGRTDAAGKARLRVRATARKIERLFVFPALGFWGALGKNVTVKPELEIALRPIDLGAPDALRHFYGFAPLAMGRAVTVGILDTGIGEHPDLAVAGGANTVQGEKESDWRDNGAGHGTHVAGIVAGRGASGRGVRGLAPGVRLRSYRVFGKGDDGASNYAILKALDRAVADGCDLVNMSLGGPVQDEATRSAIVDARAQGTLVICAAGNDARGPVAYPGAEQPAIAVSAMGRKATFPADSTHAAEVMAPYGRDTANFVAGFSNVGPEIDLTAPGVAVVSTVPGGYAAWDGTSMACPAVTAAAAALLARERRALRMVRGQARSDEMARLVFAAARSLGFGVRFEGRGML
jgi:subtilisin